MDYIYTEEDIIQIIDKFKLFNYRISPYMYLIGVNQNYLFGNISIISNELICMIHFNAGSRRLFKKYKYNEEEFLFFFPLIVLNRFFMQVLSFIILFSSPL